MRQILVQYHVVNDIPSDYAVSILFNGLIIALTQSLFVYRVYRRKYEAFRITQSSLDYPNSEQQRYSYRWRACYSHNYPPYL